MEPEHEKDYVYEAADRANCPDIQFCHRLYRKIFGKTYGAASGEQMLHDLEAAIESYNMQQAVCLLDASLSHLSRMTQMTQALRLYLEISPKDGFFGRGSSGSLVFLSDDSEAERQNLHELLSAVKKMTFAGSVIALEEAYAEIQANGIASLYLNYLAHCKKLYDRRQAWAVCYRHDLLVRGNNTNNYAEASMRILKDQIFELFRAYNIAQLLDFLVTRLPSYYERHLIDLANGRVDATVPKRFLPVGSSIPKDDIIKIDTHNYEVRSQSQQDIVCHADTSIWTCTCTSGMNGATCKHQYAAVKNFGESSLNFIPLRDPHQREHLVFIATEEKNVLPGLFTPLPIAGMTTDVNPECIANGGDVEPMQSTNSGTAEMLQQNNVNVRSGNLSDYENDDITNAGAIILASTEASLHSCTTRLIEKLRKDPG
ncbi:hypothetical protein O3P69_007951 [Scylla paramamosain]|uniref:SWIM-type domain-containing protein n=1 Tax=Scylla paramamosain TaxID=85552 RepID=A0AAW0T0F1_SCYPA